MPGHETAAADAASAPRPLWTPSPERVRDSVFTAYLHWLERERGLRFDGYRDAWAWSSTEIEAFWRSVWDFFDIRAARPFTTVLPERRMPGARWFPGAELNYAEHALRHAPGDSPAILFQSETRPLTAMSGDRLRRDVASVAASLRDLGITRGDRVAAYLPNVPEAVIAFLACASIGAIWTCASPDLGAAGVLDRFRQVEPKLLIAADGHEYAGRTHHRHDVIATLRRELSSVAHTVLVPVLDDGERPKGAVAWPELLGRDEALSFTAVPFDHPLWILYSSGTTGAPKAIVHGHGGILLEHLKALALQNDMRAGDRFLWFTTTGWMMWNVLVSGLLVGCTIVLYDGSPAHPDPDVLWRLVADTRTTRFGAGASFFTTCMRAGMQPGAHFDFGALRAIGATGSPLPADTFEWIHAAVKQDVWLASSSGGTDVASAFLGGCPTLPVHAGELQGPALGVRAEAWNDAGRAVVDEAGELVITQPLPSMPLRFWNDRDDARYRASYFDRWPDVWRHGDRVTFTARGSAVIHGRSDATLNRHGVRIGTAEVYRAVESVAGVADSLVVGVELPDGGYWMPLFVVLEDGRALDDGLRDDIRHTLREQYSPRHVPDDIIQAPLLPRTANGKKLEVAVKRVLQGTSPEHAADATLAAAVVALRWFAGIRPPQGSSSG
jgi:acetoacetyl-CoA synthetase